MTTLLLDQKPIALRVPTLEQTILDRLEEETVVGLDELVEMLPIHLEPNLPRRGPFGPPEENCAPASSIRVHAVFHQLRRLNTLQLLTAGFASS